MDEYSTLEVALTAAIYEAMRQSAKREYGGVLYEHNGKFYYTPPESSGKRDHLSLKVRIPKGSTLRGIYHTHTPGENSETFSDYDIEMAKKLKLPYYMGHPTTRQIRVFKPGESEMKRVVAPGGGTELISLGELIEEIPVELIKDD